MAVLSLRFLDPSEEELVHAESVRCLGEMGVRVHSPTVLGMLEATGAEVDGKSGIARIPEALIQEALRLAPKSLVLGARDPKHDLHLPVRGPPYAATGGVSVFIRDLDTGQRRDATRKDLADLARLSDGIEAIDAFWPLVTTADVPPGVQFAQELWTSLRNTGKHILGSAGSAVVGAPDARLQIALGALAAGGAEELRKRPLFSVLSCPVPPLVFERGAVEAQVEYARAGIPIISMSMCMGGGSAPVTVAGTLVTLNAENLASLVITQTAAPGAPQIYCSEATLVNPATGYIGYRGPEAPLLFAGAAQMARRYGLPKLTGILGVDAEEPGADIPYGELTALNLTTLSGTDLATGLGGLDLDRGCSLDQVVIDAVQWEDFRAFMRPFEITREAAALDVLRSVGHGNTFLTHPHTARHFRGQMYLRSRRTELYGSTTDRMVEDAHETARRILREHTPIPMDSETVRKGDALLAERANAFALAA